MFFMAMSELHCLTTWECVAPCFNHWISCFNSNNFHTREPWRCRAMLSIQKQPIEMNTQIATKKDNYNIIIKIKLTVQPCSYLPLMSLQGPGTVGLEIPVSCDLDIFCLHSINPRCASLGLSVCQSILHTHI